MACSRSSRCRYVKKEVEKHMTAIEHCDSMEIFNDLPISDNDIHLRGHGHIVLSDDGCAPGTNILRAGSNCACMKDKCECLIAEAEMNMCYSSANNSECCYSSEELGFISDEDVLSTYSQANIIKPADEIHENVRNVEPGAIVSELAHWANQYSVPHIAVNGLLAILSKYHVVPLDARTLLKTSSSYEIKPMKDMIGNVGEFVYFGVEKGLLECVTNASHLVNPETNSIDLLFNVDGLPLFKSSSKQFWCILGMVSLPNHVQLPVDISPFVVAVFSGNSKPESSSVFLQEFVMELSQLLQTGVKINSNIFNVRVKAFVCDAPARAFIKCIKGHTGYYGCEKCDQKGMFVDGKVVFLQVDAHTRSDDEFFHETQAEHHKGVSPLNSLKIGLVSRVPLDYMHLICLGVVRRLLITWMRGDLKVRISQQQCGFISAQLLELKPFVSTEFNRKPRPLNELDRWKAVEFRTFLLYCGPIVLRDILSPAVYHHFMLLHVAVKILASSDLCLRMCDYADQLLKLFVTEMRDIYGDTSIVYNVHNLIHLADDVRRMGNLDSFSSFPFENALGKLKNQLRSGKKPLAQLCRRLSEKESIKINPDVHITSIASRPHTDGPLLQKSGVQYGTVQIGMHRVCTLSVSESNCYVITRRNNIAQILNIVDVESEINSCSAVMLVCKFFHKCDIFYDYPCNSDMIKVYKVSRLSESFVEVAISDVLCKCMLLPRKNYFVAYLLD